MRPKLGVKVISWCIVLDGHTEYSQLKCPIFVSQFPHWGAQIYYIRIFLSFIKRRVKLPLDYDKNLHNMLVTCGMKMM